jgi:hypothetical protein
MEKRVTKDWLIQKDYMWKETVTNPAKGSS